MGLLRFLLFIAYVIPWLIMVIMICAFSRLEKAIKK